MGKILLAGMGTVILSACSIGTTGMSVGLGLGTRLGNHIGLGTSLNIPVSLDKTKIVVDSINTKNTDINIIGKQIVTYFDTQGNTSSGMTKGGFYRQLLSKRNNEYVVQDFYSDNNRKRTDPYIVNRNQLMLFRAIPSNGSLTIYAYNGTVLQQQIFQNGKLVKGLY